MGKLFKAVIKGTFYGAKYLIEKAFEKNLSLTASFGKAKGLLGENHKGFCIDGKRFLTLSKSRENYLVVAPSGKGKSQVSVYPFLLNISKNAYSIIINDPSGELSSCIPYLESKGITCRILDFGNKTGVYFNPLMGCKGNRVQMRKVAKVLLGATMKESDFFTLSAEDTIVLFIQFLMESTSKIYQNLANVYYLLLEYQGSPEIIEHLFADKASENVFRKFKALSGTSENTRKSIVSSALAALSFIGDDPILCDITSVNNIRFSDFRCKPIALFIHVPVGDVAYYAPMVSLFFQEFYRYAFSQLPSNSDLDIMMVLDEFDTLTAIRDYSEIISNSRKFKIPQQLILQSESLLSKYGEQAKNILNNCNIKCYYGGLGQESYDLERLLGLFEYVDKKNGHLRQRPLMSASEIREMKDEILVIPSGEKPLKVKIHPAYKQKKLIQRLKMKPSKLRSESFSYDVTYLDLKIYLKS